MQPLSKHREMESSGVVDTKRFGISMIDQEHIKMLLRDAIYSDKVMAVLREYSANAWDAHRMVGKADLPIEVQLPTHENPVLLIKDFGPGLSHEQAFEVATQYGASTKRGSNNEVGMLGIGFKSGFAYSDTFTVISRFEGKQRTYVAVLNEDEEDVFTLLSEEDHDPADTGITIQIAVRREDIDEFQRKARHLFQYFSPRPTINAELPEQPKIAAKLKEGLIYDRNRHSYEEKTWYAIMGCVPYKIDLTQLKDKDGQPLLSDNFEDTSGLLYFGIGEVQINASREGLKYSKITKDALVAKFESVLEEYIKAILDEVENGGGTEWNKRINLQRLLTLGLGKKELGDLGEDHVRIDPPPEVSTDRRSILVAEDVRVIRHTDQSQPIDGYNLRGIRDVIVKPGLIMVPDPSDPSGQTKMSSGNRYTEAEAWAALDKMIAERKMTGISVVDLHTLPWTPPYVSPEPAKKKHRSSPYNPKHQARMFRYLGYKSSHKLSDNWEVVNRVPQDSDVFVVLNQFASDAVSLSSRKHSAQMISEALDLPPVPEVYGYKNTEKKPVTRASTKGVHFDVWYEQFLKELPKDRIAALYQRYAWGQQPKPWGGRLVRPETSLAAIWDGLGRNHRITDYLYRVFKAEEDKRVNQVYRILDELDLIDHQGTTLETDAMLRSIKQAYPLLADAGLRAFWGPNGTEWLRYVRLVDAEAQSTSVTYADIAVPPEAEISI